MYPSESILSEAAAHLMQNSNVLGKIMSLLQTALQNGYVKPGYRGELIVHLILTIAWDRKILSSNSSDLKA
ncbi:16909_t:CDS:2 [Funneliformis geosporum]|uniref:16909_t:CDS:1 n=1 Tax=Funneliformis geosporum TaxID=1117311 RepID=A0A9W4SMX8_9GLOM|nr:16909_t:CDS:2 [Funneliformis geosporum]